MTDDERMRTIARGRRSVFAIADEANECYVTGLVGVNEVEDVYGILYFATKEDAQKCIDERLGGSPDLYASEILVRRR